MTQKLVILILASMLVALGLPVAQPVYAQEEHPHLHIDVDVKPGSYPNVINLKSQGVVAVAALGSATFNVSAIDPGSVTFGPMHHHELGLGANALKHSYQDVNGDGYSDAVFHFAIQDTDLQTTDTEACLHGYLYSGEAFCGHDSVKVIG